MAVSEDDKIAKVTLAHGIPSRPNVPVFHWTGYVNGRAQEFALLFFYYAKGDHLRANRPAGTLGGADVVA